ncbi:MAG: HAD-IA family hydrolase [Candidatus Mycalebacterium zealandia]|nr:MAG: HAD-IA family hydrolase [Candidatus Mycalebacterium zealandia]
MARAVIFDFDGVIADTEKVHLDAFRKILAPEGVEILEADYFEKYLALDDKNFFTTLLRENGRDAGAEKVADFVKKKSLVTSEMLENCAFFEGALDLINSLAEARFPLAIASGALRKEIESVLVRGGVADCFSFIASAEDCEKCKPAPEIFLYALKGLNSSSTLSPPASARECVAIEDSSHGIAAAKAAGMKCVAVTNSHPAEALLSADLITLSLREIDAEKIASF